MNRRVDGVIPVRTVAGPDGHYENLIFLPAALTQAEDASFGPGWGEDMRRLPLSYEIDEYDEACFCGEQADRVAEILTEIGHPLASSAQAKDAWDSSWAHDRAAWNAAIEENRSRKNRTERAVAQIDKVEIEFIKRLRSGRIESLAMPVIGGRFEVIGDWYWNTPDWRDRFDSGRIHLEDPLNQNNEGEADHYVFVKRDQLAQFFPDRSTGPHLEKLWPHLSPLMKVAVHGAHYLATCADEPSKAELMSRLRTLSEQEKAPISGRTLSSLVTILRSPEAAKGGAPKKFSAKRKGNVDTG